jgi:glycine/D-amino acid oxidase-like deaminating enzyme
VNETMQDVIILGGGVMGLCTAYYASRLSGRVMLLEKETIGIENRAAASFSYTRSIRNDYLEPFYARLAYQARTLWLALQQHAAAPFLIECGCLNLASASITPNLESTYAVQSCHTLNKLHLKTAAFDREGLSRRFPQFEADLGRLDVEAGFLFVPEVTRTLLTQLRRQGVRILEHVDITHIASSSDGVRVSTDQGEFSCAQLVLTAGWGTNPLLRSIAGCTMQFPLIPDRPSQSKYFIPDEGKRAQFTSDVLPVFAYLDVGIYGHPIYQGRTPGVKIGFYNPPDALKSVSALNTRIQSVQSFVEECMPSLLDAAVLDVTGVDQCYYDLVADDDFILGKLPGYDNISVGVGWRGTGYKYAPWIGQTLMQLALQGESVYDIRRFTPQRFAAQGSG